MAIISQNKSSHCSRGVSLVELLVTLSVLTLVASLIVPRFLGVTTQAEDLVSDSMAKDLNSTYATWKAAGGAIGGAPMATSDILAVLTGSSSPKAIPAHDGFASISDDEMSHAVRVSTPDSVVLPTPGGSDATAVVQTDKRVILFDSANGKFIVRTKKTGEWNTLFSNTVPRPNGQTIPVSVGTFSGTFTIQPGAAAIFTGTSVGGQVLLQTYVCGGLSGANVNLTTTTYQKR